MSLSTFKQIFGKSKAGFTLIELLVVIAIIAILSTIGLTAFASSQQKARDAKRIGDLKAWQQSAEQYYAANGYQYNATCDTLGGSVQGGIPKDPQDPTKVYSKVCSLTAYCICAQLEQVGKGNASGVAAAACPFSAGGNYFCVANLQ